MYVSLMMSSVAAYPSDRLATWSTLTPGIAIGHGGESLPLGLQGASENLAENEIRSTGALRVEVYLISE